MEGASFGMAGNDADSLMDCKYSNLNDPSFSFPDGAPETALCNCLPSFSCSSTSSFSSSSDTGVKIIPHCVSLKKSSLTRRGYKSFEDWNSDPNHIYIGREMSHHVAGALGSKWGNPFKAKKSNKNSLNKCLRGLYKKTSKN